MVATGFAQDGIGGAWPLVVRLVTADGSAPHPWAASLAGAKATRRDLADAAHALGMAGIGIGDIAAIDLYSCFPVAVAIAAREIGLADGL